MKLKKDSKTKIASVYALALYEAAEEKKIVGKVHEDIVNLHEVLSGDETFAKSFSNPLWSVDSKKTALKEIAKKIGIGTETLNCLDIIADNNRFAELALILDEFTRLYYKKRGIVEVCVQSVKKLNAVQDKKLKAGLEKCLGCEVAVKNEISPELLGGLRVVYNSNMIDDSLSGKLNRLEIAMKGGR